MTDDYRTFAVPDGPALRLPPAMTTRFSWDVSCAHCRSTGVVFWNEGGYRDMHESVTEIWGPFTSCPVADGLGGSTFNVFCAGCGRPAGLVRSRHDTPSERRERGSAHRLSTIGLSRGVVLRVHRAGELEAEAVLTPAAAMTAAADLLNAALDADRGTREADHA
jgi:hypothetical protein